MYLSTNLTTPRRSSLASPAESVYSGSLSGGGEGVGYVEGNLRITECLTRKQGVGVSDPTMVMCTRFGPDGILAVGYADGIILLYNPDTGQCLYSLSDDHIKLKHLPVTSIRFLPAPEISREEHKHILMATYTSKKIKFWHYPSGTCLNSIVEDRDPLSACFSPSKDKLVSVGISPQVNIYDVETKTKLRTLEPSDSRDVMNGHRARVFAVQYHPVNNNIFITGGWDDTVQYWDDREKHSFRSFFGPHITGDALDIDPAHDHILTGSWRKDSPLQIWDFNKGTLIKSVPQDHTNGSLLYCAQWLGRDFIVCGGSSQNMARVIDRGTLNTVGQLVDLPKAVYCLDGDTTNSLKPKLAIGSAHKIYIVKMERKQ